MNDLANKPQFVPVTGDDGKEEICMNLPATVLLMADAMADGSEPLPRHLAGIAVNSLLDAAEAHGFADRAAFIAAFTPNRSLPDR